MNHRAGFRGFISGGIAGALVLAATAAAVGAPPGGGGQSDAGSLYSDLVVALRAEDGTPILTEYTVVGEEGTAVEYCVQPVSYAAVPGVTSIANPLDGRPVWPLPLQGEWIDNPVDPLPVDEIEACDPQPQYAMFVSEAELERLNLTRTSEDVLTKKLSDVKTKLTLAKTVSLDPAGRLSLDGLPLDAAPEYAAIYKSLMTTGTVPALDFGDIGYDNWQLAAVAIGTAASKGVPLTVDSVQYYNRAVGFTTSDPLPSWPGLEFINSVDPDLATPMPVDVFPGGENFVDYSGFSYNRGDTFIGSVTWLDVATLTWHVTPVLDAIDWTNLASTDGLDQDAVNHRTLTGVTAFAQMADDARAVISYLHEYEVVLPGFYMDPVLVDTTQAQIDATTLPAVSVSAPALAFQTLPFQATASLFNPWGGEVIDGARLRVTIDAATALVPNDVAVSTSEGAMTLSAQGGDLVGWWGPDEGFAMALGYRHAIDLDVTLADAAPTGGYAVTIELVDVADPTGVLASDSVAISVNANVTTAMWGAEIPVRATQASYVMVPVRVYAPTDQDAVLTFALTGPGDDPTTDLLEELAAKDAKVYASDGDDMVPMPLSLTGQDLLTGTWPVSLHPGYNDIEWYLMVAEGAPVGQYGIDAGIQVGTDLAEPQYVSFAAPEQHGSKPPDAGEDTAVPIVTITLDALLADSVSFSFTANEEVVSLSCQLTVDGVKGAWEACDSGTITYTDLEPGAYTFAVKATDLADNTATYIKKFVIDPDTLVVSGPDQLDWVLDRNVTFVLDSTADSATYEVAVNGGAGPACAGDTCVVNGLRAGANRIEVTAVTDVSADPTSVVRKVFVPRGVADLNRSTGWTMRHNADSLFGTLGVTRLKGSYVKAFGASIKRVSLAVTKAPLSGKVHVYLGTRRLTDKPISLSGRKVNGKLIPVKTFVNAKRGIIRVVVVSKGSPVRIEGIGIARR